MVGVVRRISPGSSPSPKRYSGKDVLLEAYRRMDDEFAKLGFSATHPARARLRKMVEEGTVSDQSGLGELGRIIATAAIKGKNKIS